MLNNVKAKKSFTRIVIACLVLCLTVTGGAFLLKDTVIKATATTIDRSVGSVADWTSAINAAGNGDTLNITLTASLTTSIKLTAIPAGRTVNLNLNGCSILWDVQQNGGTSIMSTSYTSGDYANGRYWGLVTNNGTLNVTGSGTIRNKQITYNVNDSSGRGDYVQRVSAIVNTGTLTLGSNVTVSSYGANVDTGSHYKDAFIYCVAVYNTGTVTSSATINSGSMTSVYSGATNSYMYAISYGIYGGNVYVNGGTFTIEAKSGGRSASSTCLTNNQMCNYAIGVYSNNAQVKGATEINTTATSWENNNGYNPWGGSNGHQISFSAGVMYAGTNYPLIGAAVKINSSFFFAKNSTFIDIPGTGGVGYTFYSDDDPRNYARRAYPVVGINATNSIGNTVGPSAERCYNADNGFFGTGSTANDEFMDNDPNRYNNFNASMYYYAEEPYNNNLKGSTYLINGYTSETYVRESGAQTHESKTAVFNNGTPGTSSSQYVILYRYKDVAGNVIDLSTTRDANIQRSSVYLNSAGSRLYNGMLANGAAAAYGAGGDSINGYYYSFDGLTFENVASATYARRSITDLSAWGGGNSTLPAAGQAVGANNTLVVYANYTRRDPTNIAVVAENGDTPISAYTTSTSFTAEYTGRALVPGTDFQLGILDYGYETTLENAGDEVSVVTDNYNISGSGTVTYRYSSDGVNYTNGLPVNAGTYTIQVGVAADTTYAASGTYNRNGGTFSIGCVITPANATIQGPSTQSGTYGATYAELVPTSAYTVTGKNSETPTGTWSYQGITATTVPDASATGYTVNLLWTPTGSYATNYNPTSYTVTLTVNRRAATVNAGVGETTYGSSNPTWQISYTNIAAKDDNLRTSWLNNTSFEILYNGAWVTYTAGIPAGTYDARIATFGGSENTNYNFTIDDPATANGSLNVAKRTITYSAAATDRAYNGSADVNVVLSYESGNYGSDTFNTTINTTGTMINANAGTGKAVTVDASAVGIANAGNYSLVISNATAITVNIAKADPTGIACATDGAIVYDSTRTLSQVGLTATETAVAGTWSWQDGAIVPSCDVPAYTAVFNPTDSGNYNTATQSVNLTVTQKEVIISVDAKTISYGDPVPSMAPVYTGFTGSDDVSTVHTEGLTNAATTYSRGSAVGTYPINVESTLTATNYYFTPVASSVTVGKRALTVTAHDAAIVYGAAAPQLDIDDIEITGFYGADNVASLGGTLTVTPDYIIGGDVGDYAIVPAGYTSNNYEINFVSGTLTVSKATLTVAPTAQTVSYGQDAPAYAANSLYTITGFVAGDTSATVAITGAPVFTTSYVSGRAVGEYPVSVAVSAMSSTNYNFTSQSGTLTVIRAIPTIATPPAATAVHSQTKGDAEFTGAIVNNPYSGVSVAGTFSFEDSATEVHYIADDGFYTAIFTPNDTTNYETTTVSVFLSITEMTISGAPIIQGSPMVGQTLTVSLSSMNPSNAINYITTWYRGSTVITGATGTSYVVTEADIGNAIWVTVTAAPGAGYTGSAESQRTSLVIRALTPASLAQLVYTIPSDLTYDGTAHAATVAVADAYTGYVGNVSVRYNGATTVPRNAGTYTVTVDIGTPSLQGNDIEFNDDYYGPVSGLRIGTFTISPADYTVTINAQDKIYDGTVAASASLTQPTPFGTDAVGLASGITYSFTDANAGENKTVTASGMMLTGAASANYSLKVVNGTANIERRTLDARASGVSRAFNGSTIVDVAFTNITNRADTDGEDTVYFASGSATAASANAGTQSISSIVYTLGGSKASNYTVRITNEGSATVLITPATPSVAVPQISGIVYNKTRTLQSIDLTAYNDANGYWVFDDLTVIPEVSTTAYAATYVSTNRNYSNFSTNIPISVTPAPVVLTGNSMSIRYGAATPTYTITAAGFTGDDTVGDMGGSVSFSCTYTPGSNIGTYSILVYSSLDSDNYSFSTVPGTLTVMPAVLVVNASAADKVYDGNSDIGVSFTIVSGKYASDDVALSATSTTGVSATVNAGTTTVTYTAPTLTGSSAGNYELSVTPASGILTVTINKAEVAGVSFPQDGRVEFGYTLNYATFDIPGTGAGTFAYENAATTVPGAVGIYDSFTVIFTPNDARNYNTQSQTVILEVVKCNLNYVVGIAGTAQAGETITAVITGLPTAANDYIMYQWYRASDNGVTTISGATSSTYRCTDDDVGFTLVVITYFDSDAPFVFSESADVTTVDGAIRGIIGQTADAIRQITMTFWQRLMNWIQRLIASITDLMLGIGR